MLPMNTARLFELAEQDPLFSLEGAELKSMEKALDHIENALRDLETALSFGSFSRHMYLWRNPLSRSAVPLEFLRSLLTSEWQRRAFLAKPSEDGGTELVRAWSVSAQKYATAVARYRALFGRLERLEKRSEPFRFQDMFGNVSDISYVRGSLQAMAENALMLERESRERSEGAATPRPQNHTLAPYESAVLDPAQEKMLAIAQRLSTPFQQNSIKETHGPLRYTLNAFDGVPTAHLFSLYIFDEPRWSLESAYVGSLDSYLALDLQGAKKRSFGNSSLKLVMESGVSHWYQPLMLYSTRDLEYLFDIASIVDMKRRPTLDMQLVASQRSSMFDKLLVTALKDIYSYAAHTIERTHLKAERAKYSLLFGLLMHGHAGLYFLPFNRSIWRIGETMPLRGDARAKAPYENALDLRLSDNELERVIGAARIRDELRKKAGYDVLPGRSEMNSPHVAK